MADDKEPGWFARNFGSSETGIKYGAAAGTGLFALIGGYLGGFPGVLAGMAGGAILAPVLNDIFFSIARSLGGITPPNRTYDIKPLESVVDLPAKVRQKDGSESKTTVRAPLLESLQPPPADAIQRSFEKREEMRKIIVTGKGSGTEYYKAQDEARKLEKSSEQFIVTMEEYFKKCDEYSGPNGKRDELKNAIKQANKDSAKPLSDAEIESFVPSLPALSEETRKRYKALISAAIPETIRRLDGKDYPIREFGKTRFDENNTDPKIKWESKSRLEQLNYTLDALDAERSIFEKNPLKWDVLNKGANPPIDGVNASPKEMYDFAVKELSTPYVITQESAARQKELQALRTYAKQLDARNQVHDLTIKNLGTVITDFAAFSKDKLIPAASEAKQFSKERLDVFNSTGVAVFAQGALAASKGPDGKECSFLTYKDTQDKSDGKAVTLIMQQGPDGKCRVTHRLEGSVDITTDWSKAALKTPVEVNAELFKNLAAPAGKHVGEALREMIATVKAQPLQVASAAGVGQFEELKKRFESETGTDVKLASASEFEDPSKTGQPTGPSIKNSDKNANPLVKRAEYSM